MASGNSGGSIHESSSSGGGDEEYDSRTQSNINSSFFNKNPSIFYHQNPNSYYNPHAIPSPQNLHLYPQSNSFQYSNNTNISDGMIWPAGLRLTQSLQASQQGNSPAAPFSSQPDSTRNPKKRTRASRRAPTTVLTTDTTNFRQMVQEFTGIPAAPFPDSTYHRRINLLSAASGLRHGDGIGPVYSVRPPQNIVPPPFSSSPAIFNATMIDAIVTSSNKTGTAAVLSDQAGMLNLQQHDHNSIPHRFEAGASIDFSNYISDFRIQEMASAAAAGDDLKNRDGGIQEKFIPFDGKI